MKRCDLCNRRYGYRHMYKCKMYKEYTQKYSVYLQTILSAFNIPYKIIPHQELYSYEDLVWNGKFISIPEKASRIDFLITPHEIAHWIYALPHERQSSTFMLSPGDDNRETFVKTITGQLLLMVSPAEITSVVESAYA